MGVAASPCSHLWSLDFRSVGHGEASSWDPEGSEFVKSIDLEQKDYKKERSSCVDVDERTIGDQAEKESDLEGISSPVGP